MIVASVVATSFVIVVRKIINGIDRDRINSGSGEDMIDNIN